MSHTKADKTELLHDWLANTHRIKQTWFTVDSCELAYGITQTA